MVWVLGFRVWGLGLVFFANAGRAYYLRALAPLRHAVSRIFDGDIYIYMYMELGPNTPCPEKFGHISGKTLCVVVSSQYGSLPPLLLPVACIRSLNAGLKMGLGLGFRNFMLARGYLQYFLQQ